jgi:DNA-binding MarR family transcriptional regulator
MTTATETQYESLDQIDLSLSLLVRLMHRPKMRELLAAATGVSLDRAGYTVLSSLGEHGPSRLSELSPRIGVDISTACRQVQHLERLGLVDRVADPADRRASRLRLSGEGERVLALLRAARRDAVAAVIADWSPEQRGMFATLLLDLAQGMQTALVERLQNVATTESTTTRDVTTGARV